MEIPLTPIEAALVRLATEKRAVAFDAATRVFIRDVATILQAHDAEILDKNAEITFTETAMVLP